MIYFANVKYPSTFCTQNYVIFKLMKGVFGNALGLLMLQQAASGTAWAPFARE